MAEETILINLEVDPSGSIESIDNLTKANKELRKERNALNLQSEQGKKRAAEINNLIDQNTDKIKTNVSALEKQKINIGNYRSALDGVHPALGKVGQGLEAGTSGFKAMTLQALKFIATPIGAILAAIVAVFTLLKTAITSNNAVLDKFEDITNAVGVVLNVIVQRVGKLGEALIALASGNFSEAIDLTAQAFGGLGDEIENALKQGQLYLDLSRDLEDAQRALRIETARQENEIKRLVVAAKNRNLTFDEQEKLLREAISREEELVRKRAENAQKDLVITAKRIALDASISQTEQETFDEFVSRLINGTKLRDEQVDAIIDKIELLEQARGSSLAFQEKLENTLTTISEKRAEALKKVNDALAEQEALRLANARALAEEVRSSKNGVERQDRDSPLIDAFQNEADVITDIDKKLNDDRVKRNKEADLEIIRNKRRSAELEKQIEEQKLQATAGLLGAAAGLFQQQSVEYKTFATAQALISTYAAATKAYEAAFIPPTVASPGLGIAYAAAAIAQGLANVAAINGIQFAEGGYTGPGAKYQPAGVVHAGEVVWNQEDVAKAGGPARANALRPTFKGYADGGFVTSQNISASQQALITANAIKNLPPAVVSWSEGRAVGNRVISRENTARMGSKRPLI